MTLPDQARFRTKEPELATDLQREHRSLAAELAALRALASDAPRGVQRVTFSPWSARVDDCLFLHESRTVMLPSLGANSAGATITFLRESGTLTLKSDTTAQINGAQSATFSTAHRIVAQFEGSDWFAA